MIWSPQQERALPLVERWRRERVKPYFTLAGYAGTGKTTLARHLAEGTPGKVFFAAFTGKAAHVLRKTGIPATTIHKLIYIPRDRSDVRLLELRAELAGLERAREKDQKKIEQVKRAVAIEQENLRRPDFTLNSESPLLGASLLVIDEYSMVDRQMGRDIMEFGVPVLALGDPGQLPPVRGDQYFSGEPDFMLTEIHRQAEGSPVLAMSRDVREGKDLHYGTFGESQVVRRSDLGEDGLKDLMLGADQILVGTNATRRRLNREVRGHLGRTALLPQRGDKLVCLRNNHEEGLLNGQTWTVDTFRRGRYLELRLQNDDGERLSCLAHRDHFEEETVDLDPWQRRQANEFDYGYSLTVHKAQGSQWDRVLLFDEWHGSNRRQWLYTAITRAVRAVTIVEDA